MKKLFLLFVMFAIFPPVSFAASYDLTAAEVSPGVFAEGGYYFPTTLYVGTDDDPSFDASALYVGDNSDLTYALYYYGSELAYPIHITVTDGLAYGVTAKVENGFGLSGKTSATSESYAGIVGYADSGAVGVYGVDTSGSGIGVKGYSSSKEIATSGYGDYGVYVPGADYYGVYAKADMYGVYGSAENYGGFFKGTDSSNGIGVYASGDYYGFYTPDNLKTGSNTYSDVAEHFFGDDLEAGDVVVLDPTTKKGVKKTTQPYNKRVAGIVSTDPTIVMGLEDGVPIAMAGVVPVKVIGTVALGDLLTTSTIAGYAMACDEYEKCHGAIIGKAMEDHDQGKGFITALVMLG